MREIGDHAVVAVVTVQARLSIGKEMIHHERLIALTVTRLTGIFVERCYIVPMAIRTLERVVFRLELMRRQEIAGELVRVLPPFDFGERRRLAAVFGVTGAALHCRVNGVHASMRGHHILHLERDILMADHAAILHRLRLPRSNMTGAASAGNFRVRMNAAQHISGNGIQCSRAEHLPTAGNGKAHNGKRRDQGGKNTSKRKTTQAGASHSPHSFPLGNSPPIKTDEHC